MLVSLCRRLKPIIYPSREQFLPLFMPQESSPNISRHILSQSLPNFPLLQKSDYTGRIAKWGIILGAFDIKYLPRTAIKWQVLVDLVAEFTKSTKETWTKESKVLRAQVSTISTPYPLTWKLYTDKVANQKGSGVRIVLVSPEKVIFETGLPGHE